MRRQTIHSMVIISGLALAGLGAPALAENGVTDDQILFGQAAALGGPAAALGQGMQLGLSAAFAEANAAGGVHGRQLKLKSYDDGYEPDRSISHVKKLINEDQVFALIGPVGTPTSKATQPIATKAKVPFIGPFTGAGFLRNAELGNIVNVRATYGAETEAWIKHLVDGKGMKRISILYQDDAFGRVGLKGVTAALDKRGMKLVGVTRSFQNGVVTFQPDLIDNLKRGDENYLAVLDAADAYIERNGLDLPPEPEARRVFADADCVSQPILELNLANAGITTIIWATGFATDYSWMNVDAFDAKGKPVHQRGVSSEAGIYFLGLPWQSRRGSSFIWGVWHDAKYVADHIAIQRSYQEYRDATQRVGKPAVAASVCAVAPVQGKPVSA